MASPCLTLQSIEGEARPKAEGRNTSMSQDKGKVGVGEKRCGRCLLSVHQGSKPGIWPALLSLLMWIDTTPCVCR